MHTPEQAKELWCPMVRIARREDTHPDEGGAVVVAGCNTDALCGMRVPASCRCIGNKCAMWRWAPAEETRTKMRTAPNPTKPGETIEYQVQEQLKSDYGYCGLAGRPEVF